MLLALMLGREGRRLTDWLMGGGLVGWQRRCAADMVVGHGGQGCVEARIGLGILACSLCLHTWVCLCTKQGLAIQWTN